MSIDNLSIFNHFNLVYPYQGLIKTFNDTFELCNRNIEATTNVIIKATETRSYLKNTLKRFLGISVKAGLDLAQLPMSGYILFPKICGKNYVIDEYGRTFDLRLNPSDNMEIVYYREGYFRNYEEYEAFSHLDPDDQRREKIFKIMKKIEEDFLGKIYIIPAIWGIFECSWQSFGFVNFSKLLTRSKAIRKVIDDRGKFALELAKRFIDWGETGSFMIYDDFGYKSGLLAPPKIYQEYVFPWFKRICDYSHKRGVKVILHSCGDIYQLFDDIIHVGIDAIHPLEPTTANVEYNIFQLNQKFKDKICFIGNISPQDLATKDPEFINNYTKKLIKELAPGGGFILSSGHSINPAVKLENFLAIQDTLKKYGRYPISIK